MGQGDYFLPIKRFDAHEKGWQEGGKTMNVTVKLYATFRENRFAVEEMEFPSGTTIMDVVNQLKIDPKEVSIAMINGHSLELDALLSEGDTLVLFPPVGGG